MADALVAANLDLAANVCGDFTAQVTLGLEVAFEVVAQLHHVDISEVFHAGIDINTGCLQCFLGPRTAHTKDVGKSDLYSLVARKIDTK